MKQHAEVPGLRAAIYARKSTAQEDARSVTRQVEQATAYAAEQRWTVATDHIFIDDGRSGVLDETRRPGLAACLSTMDRKPRPFDVLIVAAADRLARDQFIAAAVFARLAKARLRLFYYQSREEVDLASATGKFTAMLGMFGGEVSREKQVDHMVDALLAKAKAGHVHGGLIYGYANVKCDGHVKRAIDPVQAKVVRRIFTEFTGGKTVGEIVKRLNRDRIVPPSKAGGWKAPDDGIDPRTSPQGLAWMKPTLRGVLRRELYRGVVRSTWKTAGEVFEHVDETLRIVDDRTWKEAQRILSANTRIYLRRNDGKLWGHPSGNIDSPYLMTGLIRCGICGGAMGAESRPSGDSGKRLRVYECLSHRHGRRMTSGAPCPNNVVVPMRAFDDAILRCVEPYLSAAVIADAIQTAVKRAGSRQAVEADRVRIDGELKTVEAELARLVGFVRKGTNSETVAEAIAAAEGTRRDLRAARDRLVAAQAFRASAVELESKLSAVLTDWANLTKKPVALQRQLNRVIRVA